MEVKRKIKLSWSNINIVQESLLTTRKKDEKPFWLKKYNIQSLLSLLKVFYRFSTFD